MKKIIILGGKGLIGSSLTKFLSTKDCEVLSIDIDNLDISDLYKTQMRDISFACINSDEKCCCRLKTFFSIRLPAALPQCFVGFKYAAINATVGATIAEFIGSDKGLGFYISIVTGNMRPDLAFAGIFFLTVLGLTVFGFVTMMEKILIPWHISMKRINK